METANCFTQAIRDFLGNQANVEYREQFKQYILLIGVLIVTFVIISNVMLIYGLLKTNEHLSLTKKLFVYLSAIDLMTAIISIGQIYQIAALLSL